MDKVIGIFIYVRTRLNEPSTYASLAAIMAMAGVKLDPGTVQDFLNVGTLFFGAMGFFVKEAKHLTNLSVRSFWLRSWWGVRFIKMPG